MSHNEDVTAILVELSVADSQVLYIMLSADGECHRLGTGSEDCRERELYIGRAPAGTFSTLIASLNDGVLHWQGRFTAPASKGKPCTLTVAIRFAGGNDFESEWVYGAESQGPPPAISRFVIAAIDVSQPWYDSQKRTTLRPH